MSINSSFLNSAFPCYVLFVLREEKDFFLVCNYSHMPIQQQFWLDRENNDKNNTLPLGKQICFAIVGGCAEILPKILLLLHFTNLCSVLTGDTLS